MVYEVRAWFLARTDLTTRNQITRSTNNGISFNY